MADYICGVVFITLSLFVLTFEIIGILQISKAHQLTLFPDSLLFMCVLLAALPGVDSLFAWFFVLVVPSSISYFIYLVHLSQISQPYRTYEHRFIHQVLIYAITPVLVFLVVLFIRIRSWGKTNTANVPDKEKKFKIFLSWVCLLYMFLETLYALAYTTAAFVYRDYVWQLAESPLAVSWIGLTWFACTDSLFNVNRYIKLGMFLVLVTGAVMDSIYLALEVQAVDTHTVWLNVGEYNALYAISDEKFNIVFSLVRHGMNFVAPVLTWAATGTLLGDIVYTACLLGKTIKSQ
jgi:hypothetical protein